LSWSHIIALLPLKQPVQREFYADLCRVEQWSVRTLRNKIYGMLYEFTAISKKPDELAQQEIKDFRENDKLSPDPIFRDPYFLNYPGLERAYSEKELEDAVLREQEHFILELGFTFAT
jgi:predicted nuclease of restriction endonuclease-like (RecB) superfamily